MQLTSINYSYNNFKSKDYTTYIKHRRKTLRHKYEHLSLDQFNMDKLEGIQKNLKILGNLTMKQIKFFIEHLTEIVTLRGCNNICVHCFAEAMPENHYKNNNNITRINFEDFENLCDDINKLNREMGFNIFNPKFDSKGKTYNYLTLFHDADSSLIYSTNENTGEEYDYLDLSKMINDATKLDVLFDTAGWNIQDKKTQKRIEKIVDKYVNNMEKYKYLEFNVSINPFHSIYHKSIMYKKNNDIINSEKLLDIYITRMANVIYTLTPVIKHNSEAIRFLTRCLDKKEYEIEGYNKKDLQELINKILGKLKILYQNDLNNEQKYIKDESEIFSIINFVEGKTKDIDFDCSKTGRILKTFPNIKPYKTIKENNPDITDSEIIHELTRGLIDLDGKFYILNWKETYPTNIQLNYSTKDMLTAPIKPLLNEHVIKI